MWLTESPGGPLRILIVICGGGATQTGPLGRNRPHPHEGDYQNRNENLEKSLVYHRIRLPEMMNLWNLNSSQRAFATFLPVPEKKSNLKKFWGTLVLKQLIGETLH
jgi:hypothetical protein